MPGRFPLITITPVDPENPDFKMLTDTLADAFRKVRKTFDVLGMCFGYLITVTDTGTADTEFIVTHNLGVVPDGYLVAYQDKAGSIYDGSTAWDSENIYLKASVANMSIKTLVFISTN